MTTSEPTTRIDKWLWAARAYKTRSLASEACSGGKVTINDNSAKPHKLVRQGDIVAFHSGSYEKRWKVCAIAERRGPASVARELYEDLTPPPPPRPDHPAIDPLFREPPSRRPNKRERRQLGRMKRS